MNLPASLPLATIGMKASAPMPSAATISLSATGISAPAASARQTGSGLVSAGDQGEWPRSEEHTSELQSRFGISYAVFCLKKNKEQHETKLTETFGQQRQGSDVRHVG